MVAQGNGGTTANPVRRMTMIDEAEADALFDRLERCLPKAHCSAMMASSSASGSRWASPSTARTTRWSAAVKGNGAR
jgi:hypothetical protein